MSGRERLWLPALAVLVMSPALLGDFVLDDHSAVVASTCVTGPLRPDRIVGTNFWCQLEAPLTVDAWRPLIVFLWWLLWHVGAGTPFVFHAAGIVGHATCTVQVARLGQDLGVSGRAGVTAAALFAVLPIHVDAVASVVGQADVWVALLGLLCIRAWLAGRWRCVALAVLAVTTKESGVVIVVVLLMLEGLGPRPQARRSSRVQLAGVIVAVLAVLAARTVVLGSVVAAHVTVNVNPLLGEPWLARLPAALDLVGRYVRLALVGFPLSADYSHAAVGVGRDSDWAAVAFGALALALLIALVVRRRADPPVRAVGLWLLIGLGFIANVLVLLPTLLAERLFYGPSIPACLLLGALVAPWLGSRAAQGVLGLYLAVQSALALGHAWSWTTEERITATTVAHSPSSARAHMWRARVLAGQGLVAEAAHHAQVASEVVPSWGSAHALLAAMLDLQGRPEAALAAFRRALELDPANPEVADLFVQFLLRYGHAHQASVVFETHRRARGGTAAPTVTIPPGHARLPP